MERKGKSEGRWEKHDKGEVGKVITGRGETRDMVNPGFW